MEGLLIALIWLIIFLIILSVIWQVVRRVPVLAQFVWAIDLIFGLIALILVVSFLFGGLPMPTRWWRS